MDCKTARILLTFSRPHGSELDGTDAQELEMHLVTCPECGPAARAERAADDRLGQAMRDVPVPGDFQARLLVALRSTRRPFHRRWPAAHPRAAAAAAAVFVLAVLGAYFGLRPGPAPDLAHVLEKANGQVAATPDVVEQSFAEQGVRTVAPPSFNYALLASFAVEELNGRRVPRLLFLRGQEQAYVYILSTRQFDRRECLEQPAQGSGVYKVLIMEHPTNPGFLYLVKYTGDSLEAFLRSVQDRAA